MVVIALAYLIAVSDYVILVVQESDFHKVVIYPVKLVLNVLVKTKFLIGIAELIVTPAYGRSGIASGETELYVVARIVPAACEVESTVTVGVEVLLVFVDELLRHINADIE